MSTFTTYEVRDEASGRLLYSGTLADCNTQAALLATAHKTRVITVVPVGHSVTSTRSAVGTATVVSSYT